jgi:hypothetical protein
MQFEKSNNVSIKVIDNEVFAFNRSTGVIHSFNGTGGFLVKLIAEGRQFEFLVKAMLQEYEIDEKTVDEDTKTFLMELKEKGFVSIHDR